MGNSSVKIRLKEKIEPYTLFGSSDINLRIIGETLGIRVVARGHDITLDGPPERVRTGEEVIADLITLIEEGYSIRPEDVEYVIRQSAKEDGLKLKDAFHEAISLPSKKKLIIPKSHTQAEYIKSIKEYDIVIGIGPAGTGKTYLAMGMAVSALLRKEVTRIILARPAVEAGERLGFLPGDMYEKINPYLRPLYDALYDMMETDKANRLIERGDIEIAPLAFMRGRTLNDSFIILDEAQNATSEQMKMFLTRLGFNSKVVVTGDITQVDLPAEKVSGLIEVQGIISEIEGIKFVYFTEKDVVRHKLVQDIIKAYDTFVSSAKKVKKSRGS
ncbi:MAG: PhoH family protein [Nitrospirae bacterium]|nr:PhoH family protein [Nitrospirota bacterium]